MSDINVLDHIGFVKSYVFKITNNKIFQKELIQVGCLGLVEAKENYDISKSNNSSFLSYAGLFVTGRIKQYIRDYVVKHECLISKDESCGSFKSIDDSIEYLIDKERTLDRSLQYLEHYDNKDKIKAFTCIYLDNGNGIDTLAKEHGVSTWTIRQRASLVKKDLIKHINGE